MRTFYSISELCLALGLSRSGYHAWKSRPPGIRAVQNHHLCAEIRRVHADRHLNSYGSPRMTRELHAHGVVAALANALRGPGILAEAIFHSDRGCQYTSTALRSFLPAGWKQSMSATGCCYDNAFAESCFASIKAELLPDSGSFDSHRHARRAVFDYIECYYNRRRHHSSLGYLSPQKFIELYFQNKTSHPNN